ncbi:MAG TPA: T9SS type A sorting domain-containing protein [Bacteroidales bacterium]|nr:T9SS type A sorting domain-containing protein [Bacteroidales bacterium]
MRVRDYFFIDLNQGWLTGDDGLIKSYLSTGVDINDLNPAQKTGPVIFPNPSGDILSILSDSEIRQVIIYDAWGQMVKNISGYDLETMNISDLPMGLYIIGIRDNQGEFIKKFIKN